jgi:anti-anti-sigma regulatory factor
MISKSADAQRSAQLRWEKMRWSKEMCEAWIAGCADLESAPRLAELAAELHSYRSVVLEVSALDVGDATFLRFLLGLREPGRRTVRVLGARAQLKRLFEATGLGGLFS